MVSQRLSPARLIQATNINAFVQLLCEHGALGYGYDPRRSASTPSEEDLLAVLPLFFGLMPVRALVPMQLTGLRRIRPLISTHLGSIGVQDEQLEEVLVAIADQYRSTLKNKNVLTGTAKFGIRDVRALRSVHRRLRERQGSRCVACGVDFARADETLDHVIPWQFVGDVSDGSNWQLMCQPCNSAKGDMISLLQSPISHNWLYGGAFSWPHARIHPVSRYLALRRSGECCEADCGARPTGAQLFVQVAGPEFVPTVDHLEVRCTQHVLPDSNVG